MIVVRFAPHLQRHVPCANQTVTVGSLGQVLHEAFRAAPALRYFVLDNQGHIRKHVAVFINGQLHQERNDLTKVCLAGDVVDVIQALSGG